MAISVTLAETDKSQLKTRVAKLTLDTYATGGLALTPADFNLDYLAYVFAHPTSGYQFTYDYANLKLLAYRTAGFTPAGTNAVPTSTKPTFTLESSGAIGTNMEIGFSADTAAATVEGGTGITAQRVLTTTSPVGTPTIGAPAFTGTAVAAAALIEVANAVDLSAVSTRVVAFGR